MRTHYTPARVSRLINWLAAALIALLLASAWRLDDEPAPTPATQSAIREAARQARMERALQALAQVQP